MYRGTIYSNVTPLKMAVQCNKLEIVKLLLESGNIIVINSEELACAAFKGYADIVKILLEYHSNDNIESAINGAIKRNNLQILKLLVTGNTNITILNDAFRLACIFGRIDCIKFLLGCGANFPNWSDKALYSTVLSGNLDFINFLIENGADVITHSQLHVRIIRDGNKLNNNLNILKLFVQNGYDINANATLILREALLNNFIEFAQYACENGANINLISDHIIEYLKKNNFKELLKWLHDHGVDIGEYEFF